MNEILEDTERTCQHIIEFLQSFLDDELSERERNIFERHLAICPDCQAYLESYQLTRSLARKAGAAEPEIHDLPAELARAIAATVRERTEPT